MSGAAASVRYRLTVDGLGCASCAEAVRDALSALPGVSSIEVEIEAGSADLHASAPLPAAKVASALADAGYVLRAMELVEDAA